MGGTLQHLRHLQHYPDAKRPDNIYLHEVLDTWFAGVVKPRLKGQAFMISFAYDAVLVFSCEKDALRVMEVLSKRFGKYGLTINPEKTQLIDFNKQRLRKGRKKTR